MEKVCSFKYTNGYTVEAFTWTIDGVQTWLVRYFNQSETVFDSKTTHNASEIFKIIALVQTFDKG